MGIFKNTKRLVHFSLVITVSWILCETIVGYTVLTLFGVRLWEYRILPLVNSLTSPIAWLFALILITPTQIYLDKYAEEKHYSRIIATAIAAAFIGPVVEVIVHFYIFESIFDTTIYKYTFLPTFLGSGSMLSPLYYMSLALHVPFTGGILHRYHKRRNTSYQRR